MKNIFSKNLYLQGLRKVRTSGIAMAVVIIVLNAWVPIRCMTNQIGNPETIYDISAGEFAPFGFALLLFAPLLVYNMFSYLNERKSSDFFHSLPQKRICTYISFMSAILTWIVSVLCVSALINTVLWAMVDNYVLGLKAVLLTLVGFLILGLVSAGFMALAMMLTGTTVANCLVFLLLFLFVRACGAFFLYGLSDIALMFNSMHSWLGMFELEFFLPIGLVSQIFDGDTEMFRSVWFFLYWFTVGVVLLMASAVAYCKRRSESATKSAPNRFMQNLYRIGVTFPFLMMGGYLLISESEMYLFLLCACIAFLVWVIFELLTTKKIQNVIRTLPLFLIPVILAGGYVGGVYLARNIFYATTPKRENMESVSIAGSSQIAMSLHDAVIRKTEITDSKILDQVYDAIEQTKESRNWGWNQREQYGYIHRQTVTITLRSGRKVTYNLRSSYMLAEIFKNSDEVNNLNVDLYEGEISGAYSPHLGEHAETLWKALLEDFGNMTEEQKKAYALFNNQREPLSGFYITINGNYRGQQFTQNYLLSSLYTPKAMSFYLSMQEDAIQILQNAKEQIADMTKEPAVYNYMSITNALNAKEYSINSANFNVIKEFLMGLEMDSHLTDYMNAEKIYCFSLNVESTVPEAVDLAKDIAVYETRPDDDVKYQEYISIRFEVYVTLSEADLERYQQLVRAASEISSEN